MKHIGFAILTLMFVAGCNESQQGQAGAAQTTDATLTGPEADRSDAEALRQEQVEDIVVSKLSGNDEGLTERMEERTGEMFDAKRAEIDGTVAALEEIRRERDEEEMRRREAAESNPYAAQARAMVEAERARFLAESEASASAQEDANAKLRNADGATVGAAADQYEEEEAFDAAADQYDEEEAFDAAADEEEAYDAAGD